MISLYLGRDNCATETNSKMDIDGYDFPAVTYQLHKRIQCVNESFSKGSFKVYIKTRFNVKEEIKVWKDFNFSGDAWSGVSGEAGAEKV